MGVVMQAGLFACECCGHQWKEPLPPMWTFMDIWPECCNTYANLVEVVTVAADLPAPGLWES